MARHKITKPTVPNKPLIGGVAAVLIAATVALGIASNNPGHPAQMAKSSTLTLSSMRVTPTPTSIYSDPGPQQTYTPPPSTSAAPTPSPAPTPVCDKVVNPDVLAQIPQGMTVHTIVQPFGCVTVYKIKPGDTLYDISHAFVVAGAVPVLFDWNKTVVGKDPNLILPGQVIIVDPTGKVTAPR